MITVVKAGCSEAVATVAVHLSAADLYQNAASDGSMNPPAKRRRTVQRSKTRPSHTPWSKAEMEQFKLLVATEGANKWDDKAAKLGTGRTAKALHTRWMRDQGRIIDRPRLKDNKDRVAAAGSVAAQVTAPVAAAAAVGKHSRNLFPSDPMSMCALRSLRTSDLTCSDSPAPDLS